MICPNCGSEKVSYWDYPAGLLVCENCGHLFWDTPWFPEEEEEDDEDFDKN